MVGPGIVVVERTHLFRCHDLLLKQNGSVASFSWRSALFCEARKPFARLLPIAVSIDGRLFFFPRHLLYVVSLGLGRKHSAAILFSVGVHRAYHARDTVAVVTAR